VRRGCGVNSRRKVCAAFTSAGENIACAAMNARDPAERGVVFGNWFVGYDVEKWFGHCSHLWVWPPEVAGGDGSPQRRNEGDWHVQVRANIVLTSSLTPQSIGVWTLVTMVRGGRAAGH